MIRSHYKSQLASRLLKISDAVIIVLLFLNTREYVMYGQLIDLNFILRIEYSVWHFLAVISLATLWYAVFSAFGMYRLDRLESWPRRLIKVAGATGLGVAAILLLANLVGVTELRSRMPALLWGWATGIFLAQRTAFFLIVQMVRRAESNVRFVVIVGGRERALALWRRLSRLEQGFKIIGFVDDPDQDGPAAASGARPSLCSLAGFGRYISENPVDEVLITLPIKSRYDQIVRVIRLCAEQGLRTRLLTDLFDLPAVISYHIERLGSLAFITYETDTRSDVEHDLKRLLDIAAALFALVVFSPLFLLISLAICIDDGWPVLFFQQRVGLNKRRFWMAKFRTMVKDAERRQTELEARNESSGATFKIANDPRVTRLGRFLRRTSLDELPQLFNVLAGSMSLVGPRPLPIRDFERFYDDSHRRRFSVKPGITGLWQVSGRSDIDFEEWMRLDIYYVDNWSLLLDVRILLQTVRVVLAMKGAY